MPSSRAVIAVDLGKSRCRAVLMDLDATPSARIDGAVERRSVYDSLGAPGLAAADGVAAALAAILPLRSHLDGPLSAVTVGAAGAWAAPAAAADLAGRLSVELGVPATVTSDVVSAHAGALGGGPGALLIAGTGAAALGIDAVDGTCRTDRSDGDSGVVRGRAILVDGWGPELGDFGSGSWVGREALRAVLRSSVGLGPDTALTHAVSTRIGAPSGIQGWLAQGGPLARRLATLAPLVLDAAEAGDEVADIIVSDAVRLLVASAVAASSRGDDVALHGGLTGHDWFRSHLDGALRRAGRSVVSPAGDALDGALLLAQRADLPHERFVHRAG